MKSKKKVYKEPTQKQKMKLMKSLLEKGVKTINIRIKTIE